VIFSRRGAVHMPLFTAFAPAATTFRLADSGAKVVVADEHQRDKLDPAGAFPPGRPGASSAVAPRARMTWLWPR